MKIDILTQLSLVNMFERAWFCFCMEPKDVAQLSVLVTNTGTARAGAWDHNHQVHSSQDQKKQKSLPFIPADLFPV